MKSNIAEEFASDISEVHWEMRNFVGRPGFRSVIGICDEERVEKRGHFAFNSTKNLMKHAGWCPL